VKSHMPPESSRMRGRSIQAHDPLSLWFNERLWSPLTDNCFDQNQPG
jgi:hypothetical protein